MSLLHDILKWTEGLPMWQRHAARLLFEKEGVLSKSDYAELFSLLKSAHGVATEGNIEPVALAASHLPANANAGSTVVLKAMRDLKNVNKIATGQKLTFGINGLTIIYGPNGSGKSGYSRVMKQACRARDQGEIVLPDASDAASHGKVPEAAFDIEVNGAPASVAWKANSEPPEALSAVAVFDSHCARAYVTEEQEVAYLPYGLDVVENLANKVIPEVAQMLSTEIASINVDRQPLAHLLGETKVGALIGALNEKTKPDSLSGLATLSTDEVERHAHIVTALAEADPSAKAKIAQLTSERMKQLAERLRRCALWCSDGAVAKLKDLYTSAKNASDAERAAAAAFRAGETLLAGTGDPIWKTMFEAAQKYSTEVAYPGHSFPHTSENAQCPLCQQELEDGAARLERFSAFIKDDVGTKAASERQKVETAKSKIAGAVLDFGFDQALLAEVKALQPELVTQIQEFMTSVLARRDWMLSVLEKGDWDNVPSESSNPRRPIRNLAARFVREARTLAKASNETARKALQKELNELNSRLSLAKSLDGVLSLLGRLKSVKALEACRKDLNTRAISDQSKAFASSAVTTTLRAALNDEFKALGIGHVQAVLKERGSKGKTLHQLVLNLPLSARLDHVLSEGEQRAIALGSFLAELSLAGHHGPIVFDDPVSSLDHHRRQHVSRRLAEEGAKRQVIIFTHDTSFLGQLRDEIDNHGLPSHLQYLEWRANRPGNAVLGLPWGHKSYRERLHLLKSNQEALVKRPWPAYPNEAEAAEMRYQYDLLRATIERVIQDVVFNGVVRRYRDWIRVDSLEAVVGFELHEYAEIARIHQKCNETVTGHDPSSDKNTSAPTASDLGNDIADLETVIKLIQSRREKQKGTPKI
jgi:energy-coupling factor transporter ATP-binding protein EcfA2